MCTVTYLPVKDGFILTHNRDEAPSRSPKQLTIQESDRQKLLFPRDTKAGGSWIVAGADGQVACLLNGAFEKHAHQPPYRRSRGLILMDFMAAGSADGYLQATDLEGIEPFTLLHFTPFRVLEFRWDGVDRHFRDLPSEQSHFWCSATLYPAPMRARREQVFRDWLARQTPDTQSPENILRLHLQGGVGDPENDYVMDRAGRVKTVSITQIVYLPSGIEFSYFDLLEGASEKQQLPLLIPFPTV